MKANNATEFKMLFKISVKGFFKVKGFKVILKNFKGFFTSQMKRQRVPNFRGRKSKALFTKSFKFYNFFLEKLLRR